jgi:hypothetical protein
MMAAITTIDSAFVISRASTIVPMTEFEPARVPKAVCVADSSPDKDKSFLVVEMGNIRCWQTHSTAWKARFCGQNDFCPQWQLLKFVQILIIRPANFDSNTKFSRRQTPNINESKLPNDITILRLYRRAGEF